MPLLQNESPEHPDTKLVTLRGAADNVAKAKESIKQLLEEALAPQEGEMEEKIPCPAGIVGRIIGRGGETIRWVVPGLLWERVGDAAAPAGVAGAAFGRTRELSSAAIRDGTLWSWLVEPWLLSPWGYSETCSRSQSQEHCGCHGQPVCLLLLCVCCCRGPCSRAAGPTSRFSKQLYTAAAAADADWCNFGCAGPCSRAAGLTSWWTRTTLRARTAW